MGFIKYIVPLFLAAGLSQAQLQAQEQNIEKIEETREIIKTGSINKGIDFFKEAEYDSAHKYLLKDIELIEEKVGIEGNELIYALDNAILAGVYMKWEELDKALEHFSIAKENFKKENININVARCDYEIARILERQGKTSEAIITLEDAINMKEQDISYKFANERFVYPVEFKEMSEFYWQMTEWLTETKSTINNKSYHHYFERAMDFEILYDKYSKDIKKALDEQREEMKQELDKEDEQDKKEINEEKVK